MTKSKAISSKSTPQKPKSNLSAKTSEPSAKPQALNGPLQVGAQAAAEAALTPNGTRYWLMKSEPDVYSLERLLKEKTTLWSGVRNYAARNYMMNDMKLGDEILFYHSNAEPAGVAGVARVTSLAEPDPTQFDKKSEYFDEKASKAKPRWFCVQVGNGEVFKKFVTLQDLRDQPELQDMLVLQNGSRLSVQPVLKKHFDFIKKWGGAK